MSATGDGTAGFTLIELLVVLAILGLVGGIVYPALARSERAQALGAATAAIAAALREAHGRAMRFDRPVSVSADAAGLAIAGGAPRSLPAPVRLATVPARGIMFLPDGSSSGGWMTLSSGDRSATIAVSAASGLVRIAR